MTVPEPKLTIDQSLKIVRTIYPMMFVSAIMFAVVGEMMMAEQSTPQVSIEFFWILTVISISLFAGTLGLKQLVIAPAASEILATNGLEPEAIGKWQAGHLIAFALAEAIVIFSLVLRFLGFPNERTWIFVGAGIVALILAAPTDPRR